MAARLGIWKIASSYQEFSDPQKGMFDASPDKDGVYPKISRTKDYVEIIWKKYLPVLCGSQERFSSINKMSLGCVTCLTTYRVFADGTVRCILDYDPHSVFPPCLSLGGCLQSERITVM